MTDYDVISLFFLGMGVLFPVAFTFYLFLNRRRVYAAWSRCAVIIMCLVALAAGTLSWPVLHWQNFHLTREAYDKLVGVRNLLGGICIGIMFSIWLARPYRNKAEANSDSSSPSRKKRT